MSLTAAPTAIPTTIDPVLCAMLAGRMQRRGLLATSYFDGDDCWIVIENGCGINEFLYMSEAHGRKLALLLAKVAPRDLPYLRQSPESRT